VRLLLFGVGVVAVGWFVRRAGASEVIDLLAGTVRWLPLLVFLELAFVGADVVSLQWLLGDEGRKVPARTWVRSALLAYGSMILVPAGRAGGEIVRGAMLGRHVGHVTAAVSALRLQGVTSWGNAAVSLVCAAVIAACFGVARPLVALVALNAVIMGGLGALFVLGSRHPRVRAWLAARARVDPSELERLPGTSLRGPLLLSFGGRLAQTLFFGVLVLAVGGTSGVGAGFSAQGIHLVGAGLGDFVPNQAGVNEGAFAMLAPHFGWTGAVAIAIPLLHRATQVLLAVAALMSGALIGRRVRAARSSVC